MTIHWYWHAFTGSVIVCPLVSSQFGSFGVTVVVPFFFFFFFGMLFHCHRFQVWSNSINPDIRLFSCTPSGRLPQLRGRKMTRANREVRRSPDPRKKELTKAGAERRTARDAVLPVGAAGQRLLSLNINKCCQVPISLFPVIIYHW